MVTTNGLNWVCNWAMVGWTGRVRVWAGARAAPGHRRGPGGLGGGGLHPMDMR